MIYNILGVSALAILIAETSGIMNKIKYVLFKKKPYEMRLKPFDCPLCLSFWLGLVYFSKQVGIVEAMMHAAICSLVSLFTIKLLHK